MHFEAACHLLAYLVSMASQTICYQRSPGQNKLLPYIHINASYSTDLRTAKSISRHITILARGAIVWYSQLQSVVSLSSTKAKLGALTEATHQALYLRRLFVPFSLNLHQPTNIFCDNQSTLAIVQKPPYTYHTRLKHFTIKEGFVHNNLQSGVVKLFYVPMNNNLANFLTKAVLAIKLRLDKAKLNLASRE
jgi:hypothetical protein